MLWLRMSKWGDSKAEPALGRDVLPGVMFYRKDSGHSHLSWSYCCTPKNHILGKVNPYYASFSTFSLYFEATLLNSGKKKKSCKLFLWAVKKKYESIHVVLSVSTSRRTSLIVRIGFSAWSSDLLRLIENLLCSVLRFGGITTIFCIWFDEGRSEYFLETMRAQILGF